MNTETTPEISPQEELSIGALLRTEREKAGISKSRMAEIIKVREQFIDALESEEWDKLPARVFIKGFIRSYAISIGYDTKVALRLFDKCMPSRGEDSPVPLTGNRKKSRTMYYAVPILIILAAAVYLFMGKDKVENDIEHTPSVADTSSSAGQPAQPPALSGQAESVKADMPVEIDEKTINVTAPAEKKTMVQNKPQDAPKKEAEKAIEVNASAAETFTRNPVTEEENIQTEELAETIGEEEPSEEDGIPYESPATPLMTLSATVNERTYVKIIIDDNPPKEYIFQPGANPNWTAERGFEVTVGNAAGIEFIFNGETFNNIGRPGRVKTVRFPEEFRPDQEEE
ncbi:MAG: DUF4115 domain-containing protein [Deltaproteobacteria bacterium]|nr:DUF4115 domain-containing protein [Deltaproteobacteria bacterium]